jgi:2-octaprenyl-6-methoxyphenol hydroxylase
MQGPDFEYGRCPILHHSLIFNHKRGDISRTVLQLKTVMISPVMKIDVIILGGGPNGLATALSLGGAALPRPLNVLLLDARDPQAVPSDSRGTALTTATQSMFKALGVWNDLAGHACDMRDIIVTDGAGRHDARKVLLNLSTDATAQAAATMVENRHLANALLAAVARSSRIHLQGGFEFTHFECSAGRIKLHSKSGTFFTAPLLVAADGRNSRVRKQLDITLTAHDYKQTALTFAIDHSLPHANTAEEHFSSAGVFAFLPLPGNRASIVWGTSPERATSLMALDDTAFNMALQDEMGWRVGAVQVSGKRAAYPLSMQIAQNLVAPRVALLGDAAHAIHPLAGLGLNLGFKDAAALADCVVQAFARGDDIGGVAVLERYEMLRRFETTATSFAMDAMNGLFSNADPGLKVLRSAGLRMVEHVPALKSHFMAQAAGTSQNNPRLLQGLLPG